MSQIQVAQALRGSAARGVPALAATSRLHTHRHPRQVIGTARTQYLGVALQKVLRQYTNAAATFTTEILSFTSRFAIQVLFGRGCGRGI